MLVSIPERVLEALKRADYCEIAIGDVSIPERVLEALKPMRTPKISPFRLVSIPERVLEALKPHW